MKGVIFLFLLFSLIFITQCQANLQSDASFYYQEKYFRFLANNYEEIERGDFWTYFPEEMGIGFKAVDDFGSFILVKDWSMYSFKLTKIVFRPYCSYKLDGNEYQAEMLLIHTIDNGYYPPGRRIYLGINYLVISIPFKKSSDLNPANDKLFHFMSLELYKNSVLSGNALNISPFKSIKLHQIIQHQPSYLFETTLKWNENQALYMVFSKFHYISEKDFENLARTYNTIFTSNPQPSRFNLDQPKEYYRNWDNSKELEPQATLMAYNFAFYPKISFIFVCIAFALLL